MSYGRPDEIHWISRRILSALRVVGTPTGAFPRIATFLETTIPELATAGIPVFSAISPFETLGIASTELWRTEGVNRAPLSLDDGALDVHPQTNNGYKRQTRMTVLVFIEFTMSIHRSRQRARNSFALPNLSWLIRTKGRPKEAIIGGQ